MAGIDSRRLRGDIQGADGTEADAALRHWLDPRNNGFPESEPRDLFIRMLVDQGGRCAACKEPFGLGGNRGPRIDHDHKTGRIRGLLCHGCNVAAGFLKDSPATCENLADYLGRPASEIVTAEERTPLRNPAAEPRLCKDGSVAKPDESFLQIIGKFVAYLDRREKSANTIRAYRQDLTGFASWYAASADTPLIEVAQITSVDLREWKRDLTAAGQKPASVNRRLSSLQSFLRWSADASLIGILPERPLSIRQVRPGPQWLDRRDRLAFLRAVEHGDPRDRAIAVIFLNTGLRVSEMAALKWPDVRISERKGTLIVRSGKGSKWREVQLNDEARKAFVSVGYFAASATGSTGNVWVGTRGALGTQGVEGVVRRFAAKAGVDATCHTLRHTFCHDLIAAGIGIEKVASLAGHDNIQTTRRYVEPSAADLQAAVDRLGG